MKPARKPELLWCRMCRTGYASVGERPELCPECKKVPHWTRTPPYVLSGNDRRFLKSLRIDPDGPTNNDREDDGA